MKKLSIILLVLVMLTAAVSCEKDKSGEMVTTYEDFVKAYNNGQRVKAYFSSASTSPSISIQDLEDTIETLDDSTIHIDDGDAAVKGGSEIKLETSDDGKTKTYTYNNIVITYKYTESAGDTDKKDGTFSLTGSYSVTDETDGGKSYSFDVTMNDTNFKFAYSQDAKKNYTSASIGDKSVELRLLNTLWY